MSPALRLDAIWPGAEHPYPGCMLAWEVLGVLLAAAAVVVVVVAARSSPKTGVAAVLRAHGPARCLAAIKLLHRLAERGDEAAIAIAWDSIELPLVEALPDCPPDAKPDFVATCDALAQACANRGLAKRVMTVRNSLLPG